MRKSVCWDWLDFSYTTEEEEHDCLSQQSPYNIYLSSPTGIVADHKMKYTLNPDKEALFVPHTLKLGSAIWMVQQWRVRSLAMLVTHSLTDSVTHSRLANLIDVTLACEDAYSELVEIATHCLQKGPYFKDLVLNRTFFGILGPYWVLIYISGSLFSLFWFHSRKECQFSLHVNNNELFWSVCDE